VIVKRILSPGEVPVKTAKAVVGNRKSAAR
jgi:hypothetical protein